MPARDDLRWNHFFDELKEFKLRRGHTEVPRFAPDRKLGQWVSNQRALYASGKLRPERRRRLETIGFAFSQRDGRFERFLRRLVAFKKAQGHCTVPAWWPDQALVSWRANMLKRGRIDELSPEQRRRLEEVGFFEPTFPRRVQRSSSVETEMEKVRWEQMFQRLKEFHRMHGHCRVVSGDADQLLHFWVRRQRAAGTRGLLPPEQHRKLEALGFMFDVRQSAWEDGYAELAEFERRHGHCDVTSHDGGVYEWTIAQRKSLRAGRLSPEREKRLEGIGFRFVVAEPKEDRIERRLGRLEEFRAKHGHLLVPTRSNPDTELVRFVLEMRGDHNRGTLPKDLERRLDALGFVWDARQFAWESMFARLVVFHCEHGHTCVPKGYHDEELATWTRSMRAAKREGSMPDDRARRLDELGFQWRVTWGTTPELDTMMERVRALPRDRKGRVDQRAAERDLELMAWLSARREQARDGTLHPLLLAELNSLGLLDEAFDRQEQREWEEWADRLARFRDLRGREEPAQDSRLGRWVEAQRNALARDELEPEQVEVLRQLGIAPAIVG